MKQEEASLIGGSDLSGILGLSPWATPLTVYARIVSGQWDAVQTAAMRRGTLMEPVVREMYRLDTGAALLGPQALRHPRLGPGRANFDDIARHGGERRLLEIKTDGRAEAGKWGEVGTDEIPESYLPQVHYYLGTALEMGLIDSPVADVAVLLLGVDDSPRIYRVAHDADVYGWLLEAAERFWRDHVVPRCPPAPTLPAREQEAVRRIYGRDTEPLVDFAALPPEDKVAVLAYAEARRIANAAEAELAGAEVALKLAIGWRSGVSGLPPDSGLRSVTWKADKQGKTSWKDVAESLALETGVPRERVLSLADSHRGEPGRTLRVTETKETG